MLGLLSLLVGRIFSLCKFASLVVFGIDNAMPKIWVMYAVHTNQHIPFRESGRISKSPQYVFYNNRIILSMLHTATQLYLVIPEEIFIAHYDGTFPSFNVHLHKEPIIRTYIFS